MQNVCTYVIINSRYNAYYYNSHVVDSNSSPDEQYRNKKKESL